MVDNIRGNRCLLCLGQALDRCLCPDCLRDLPWQEHACQGCALPLPPQDDESTALLCADCLRQPPLWRRAQALFRYDFPIDRLIAAFKYHGRLALSDLFGCLLADSLAPVERPDLILPVPVHSRRLRQRGYNQTALLAVVMSRRLGVDCDRHSLCRLRDTVMQKNLSSSARLANLQAAFIWRGPPLTGRRVLLVDDVMTTGATVQVICPMLLAAGAESIDVIVLARTLPP